MAHLLDNPPICLALLFGADICFGKNVSDGRLQRVHGLRRRMGLFAVVDRRGGEEARGGLAGGAEERVDVRTARPEELAREHHFGGWWWWTGGV